MNWLFLYGLVGLGDTVPTGVKRGSKFLLPFSGLGDIKAIYMCKKRVKNSRNK